MQSGERRPRRRRIRLVVIVVAGVLVVLGGLGAVAAVGFRYVSGLASAAGGGSYSEEAGIDGPVDAPVERLDLVSSVAATGALASARPVVLGFPGPGEITELVVAVGDPVTAGQVLARQDPRLAQLDLDAAAAALTAAERAAGLRGPATGEEQRAADARAAEARVAVAAATTSLERTRTVVGANAAALQSAIDAAGRQVQRDTGTVAAAEATVSAAVAAEPTTDAMTAATAEREAAGAEVTRTRAAEVAAAEAVTAATASGDDSAIATAQARLAAAGTAALSATARLADITAVLDAAAVSRAATTEARAVLAAAQAALGTSSEGVVTARDARRSGQAGDAQTVDAAASALAQAKAALQVLLTGRASEGTGGGADGGAGGGTSPEELQVAVARAELEVERALTALDRLTIVAPTDATVTKVNASVGDTLGETGAGGGAGAADEGTGTGPGGGAADVITLTTAKQMVAEITVPETDAIKLEPGQPAEFKFSAIPDVIGTGKVLTVQPTDATGGAAPVDPYADPSTTRKTYTVTMSVEDLPPGARGGLTIAARITIGAENDALVVPTASLAEFEGTAVVQRVTDDGQTEEVEVTTGLRQGGYTQVIDGLAEGDQVRIGGDGSLGGGDGGPVGAEVIVDGG